MLVRKARPTESFFNFLTPPVPPTEDATDDDEALDELDEKLKMYYQLGKVIKEQIIPKAVDFFGIEKYDMMEEDDDYDDEDLGDVSA
jgi:nucleosome assembly protein 1-like 1